MSKEKYLTAHELAKKLLELPKDTIIVSSDYRGYDHQLYGAHLTYRAKNDEFDLQDNGVDDGTQFVNNKQRFKHNIAYIGHKKYNEK